MRRYTKEFSEFELNDKLHAHGWRGKYFNFENKTTYLSEDNKTIAIITYDNRKSIIIAADFKYNGYE